MITKLTILSAALLLIAMTSARAQADPLALVYRGAGSCTEGCSESPGNILTQMGYEVRYVGPTETNPKIFEGASVWIQPGGLVREQYQAMSAALKRNIVQFVNDGGGYVGICAGAFLASEMYSWNSKRDGIFVEYGLNFFPGISTVFNSGIYHQGEYVPVEIYRSLPTGPASRYFYWEEGPVFFTDARWKKTDIEIVNTYPNGQPATLRRSFGKGKVYVTAFHPEAPQDWRAYHGVRDPDGTDFDFLRSMIQWVNP